jgi:hypothetical protein
VGIEFDFTKGENNEKAGFGDRHRPIRKRSEMTEASTTNGSAPNRSVNAPNGSAPNRSVNAPWRSRLRAAWSDETAAARAARERGDPAAQWKHLERAHILSQPLAGAHVRTHLAMFGYAFRRRDLHEIVGQVLRIIVAAPGSWTGRYPVGNTGGANVSAFRPLPVADDLRPLLEPAQ